MLYDIKTTGKTKSRTRDNKKATWPPQGGDTAAALAATMSGS